MTPPDENPPKSEALPRLLTDLARLLMMVLFLFVALYGVTWLLDRAGLVPAPNPVGLFVFCTLVVANNMLVFWASYGFLPSRNLQIENNGVNRDLDGDPAVKAARERWFALPEGDRPARGVEPDRSPDALFWSARAAKEFVGGALWFFGFLWLANGGKTDPRPWGLLVLFTALYAGYFRLRYGVFPSTAVRPPRPNGRPRTAKFETDRLAFLAKHAKREIPPEWSAQLAGWLGNRKS